MHGPDRTIENRDLHDVLATDRQERADQHRPDVLDAVRGEVGQQDGAGRGRGVHHADHGLLRHAPLTAAREREDERAHERRDETRAVRLPGVKLVAEEKRRRGAEGGDLGERDVDEDHLARQYVDAQVGVDAREDQTHEEGRPQERQEIGEHAVGSNP